MKKLHAIAAWIQQETSARRPRLDKTGVVMRTASVLLLLLPGREGPELLFEVRSSRLGWQPGDICFPGGRRENRGISGFAVRWIFLRPITVLWCILLWVSGIRRTVSYPVTPCIKHGILTKMKLRNCSRFRFPGSWKISPVSVRPTFRSPARMIFPLNWYPIWIPTRISTRSMKFTFTSMGIR